jgi:hypothetical protein
VIRSSIHTLHAVHAPDKNGSRMRGIPYRKQTTWIWSARRVANFLYTEICKVKDMKTTLDLDDHLLTKAKAFAAHEKKSLTRLIEEGLSLRLRKPAYAQTGAKPILPVYRGQGGLVEGVNPLSNRSMFDAADSDA